MRRELIEEDRGLKLLQVLHLLLLLVLSLVIRLLLIVRKAFLKVQLVQIALLPRLPLDTPLPRSTFFVIIIVALLLLFIFITSLSFSSLFTLLSSLFTLLSLSLSLWNNLAMRI